VETVAADAPLPIPALRYGIAVGVFRQSRVESGVEDRDVRELRDRGQAGLHRGHGDAVVEWSQTAERLHFRYHRRGHKDRLPEMLAAVNDAVSDGAQRGGRDARFRIATEQPADIVGRVALGSRVHAPIDVHFRQGRRRERGKPTTPGRVAPLPAGDSAWAAARATVSADAASTTLDLSELDPGFRTRTRMARRLPVP
jgi:hypothetical protein